MAFFSNSWSLFLINCYYMYIYGYTHIHTNILLSTTCSNGTYIFMADHLHWITNQRVLPWEVNFFHSQDSLVAVVFYVGLRPHRYLVPWPDSTNVMEWSLQILVSASILNTYDEVLSSPNFRMSLCFKTGPSKMWLRWGHSSDPNPA